jgi:beta-glucosidase
MLNVRGAKSTREIQAEALKSRLHIPLLFSLDVIHGYKTVFPIPLAEAASWDLDAIRLGAHVAAKEAAAAGLHWTFAPMVDVGRDPRWGRVMEGAGEDTYAGAGVGLPRREAGRHRCRDGLRQALRSLWCGPRRPRL